MPSSADLDWGSLGFSLVPTKSHVKLTHKGDGWSDPDLVTEPYVTLHIGATALHYGQACFEGLKAFAREDGRYDNCRVFKCRGSDINLP